MTAKKVKPIISDKVIRFLLGTILFFALIIGGTYYLQSSLIVLHLNPAITHLECIFPVF